MSRQNRTHTPKTDLTEIVERKPRRGRLLGEVPQRSNVEGIVAAALVVAAASLGAIAVLPSPLNWVVAALGVAVGVGGVLWARRKAADVKTGWVRNLGYAAAAVGFRETSILCAGPQLALVKTVDAAPIRVLRSGEIQIGGRPLHRIVGDREDARLAKKWGATVDVIVAVDDTDTEVEPMLAALGKTRQVVVVGRSDLAGVVLGLPSRLGEDADPVAIVEDFLG